MNGALRVADMVSYLAATGWLRRPGTWRGATLWDHPSGYEALVPARDGLDDAEDRSWELLRVLAKAEGRPVEEIAEDIASPMMDLQSVRTFPANLPSGYVGLRTGLRTLQAVRDLFNAAAWAEIVGPSPQFRGNHPQPVDDLLETVQLGPSKAGSYILTLRVPVQMPDQQELWGEPDFRSRGALRLLFDAVNAAHQATETVNRTGDYSGFVEAVDRGVSGNLCKALSDLGGLGRQQRFEIGFRWARGLPTQLPAATVAFPAGAADVLYQASRKLEWLVVGTFTEITGTIDRLVDEPATGDRWRIRVRGELFARDAGVAPWRVLWVRLSQVDYQRALEAHGENRRVRVRGMLEVVQRRLELVPEPDGFEIMG